MLDTFKTNWPLNTLVHAIRELALTTTAFEISPTEEVLLGVNKDVPVKLLKLDNSILALHNKLLELSAKGSFVFNTPEFVGYGFLPHATDQKNDAVQIGQKYRLDSISLIDMFPDGDFMRRSIIDTFTLKD
jgi:hypothetical protein